MITHFSSKTFLVLAFIGIILVTCLNLIPFHGRKQAMDVKLVLRGIPKHGLLLVGYSDPSFDDRLNDALGDRGVEISNAAKLLIVFVTNSSERLVVAYHVKWDLVDVNGKTESHLQTYSDPSLLMENARTPNKRTLDLGGNSIAPRSSRLVSLVPSLTDLRSGQGSIGGGFIQPRDGREVDAVTRALQDRNTTEVANKFAETLSRITTVTVSLDGAFFDDGTFVGRDETGFFSKFKATLDARYDLYNSISKDIRSKKEPQEVLERINKFAKAPRMHLGPSSSAHDFYTFYRKVYAEEISRNWNFSGEQTALRLVETRLRNPWTTVKKTE